MGLIYGMCLGNVSGWIRECGSSFQAKEKISSDTKVDGCANELNSHSKECKE